MSTSCVSTSLVHLREDWVSSILSKLPCIRMCSNVRQKPFFTRAVIDCIRPQENKLWFTYLLSVLVCFWSEGAW